MSESGQVSFHATDPDDDSGFAYTCQVDTGPVAPCSSPFTYSGLDLASATNPENGAVS